MRLGILLWRLPHLVPPLGANILKVVTFFLLDSAKSLSYFLNYFDNYYCIIFIEIVLLKNFRNYINFLSHIPRLFIKHLLSPCCSKVLHQFFISFFHFFCHAWSNFLKRKLKVFFVDISGIYVFP